MDEIPFSNRLGQGDHTIEKTALQPEKEFRSLFLSVNDGICFHEIIYENGKPVDYRILDANPKYETMTGICREDAIGSLASELYGSGDCSIFRYLRESCVDGGVDRF